MEAVVLRVKKGNDTDSLIISQWEGACESITQAGYKIVFVTRRLFYLVMMDWKFYKAVFICQPSKQSWQTKLTASLNGEQISEMFFKLIV